MCIYGNTNSDHASKKVSSVRNNYMIGCNGGLCNDREILGANFFTSGYTLPKKHPGGSLPIKFLRNGEFSLRKFRPKDSLEFANSGTPRRVPPW